MPMEIGRYFKNMIQLTYFSHLLQDEMNHTLKVPISLYWLLKESRVTALDADVSVIDFCTLLDESHY